jgi:hypothetical protein
VTVDVRTLDDQPMTAAEATQPVGSALRIATAFIATSVDDATGIETTIEARFDESRSRYVTRSILTRAIRDDFDEIRLKHTAPQAILQVAVPHCVALLLDDDPGASWTSVSQLTEGDTAIIPSWMATAVVKRGMKDERWEVIEILYAIAALADLPPVKLIARELAIPERTASDWIQKARAAGRLVGIASNVGRPAGS